MYNYIIYILYIHIYGEREQFQGLNASDQIPWSTTSTLSLKQADKLHTLQKLYFIKLYFMKIYSTFRFCCNLWKRSTLGTFVRKLVPQITSSNVKDYKICVTKNCSETFLKLASQYSPSAPLSSKNSNSG